MLLAKRSTLRIALLFHVLNCLHGTCLSKIKRVTEFCALATRQVVEDPPRCHPLAMQYIIS